MHTVSKLFFSCFLCLALTLLSGCENKDSDISLPIVPPTLTPAEQAEVDRYIATHGRDAILHYVREMRGNEDGQCVLTYLKYFVSQGADVNAKDRDGFTPLHWATGLPEVRRITYGGVPGRPEAGRVLRYQRTQGSRNVEAVKYLVSRGADVNSGVGTFTPLHGAALNGNVEIVRFLVSKGANINAQAEFQPRDRMHLRIMLLPLHLAVLSGDVETAKFLVSQGAQIAVVRVQSVYGEPFERLNLTLLDIAKGNQHTAMVEYLTGL